MGNIMAHSYTMQNTMAHFDTITTTQCMNILAHCTITLWATLRHCARESRETRNTRLLSTDNIVGWKRVA